MNVRVNDERVHWTSESSGIITCCNYMLYMYRYMQKSEFIPLARENRVPRSVCPLSQEMSLIASTQWFVITWKWFFVSEWFAWAWTGKRSCNLCLPLLNAQLLIRIFHEKMRTSNVDKCYCLAGKLFSLLATKEWKKKLVGGEILEILKFLK